MRVLFSSIHRRLALNLRLSLLALSGCFGLLARAQTVTQFAGTTVVGQPSAAMTVTVTMTGSGTTAAPAAVTQGVANLDFAITGGTCSAGAVVSPGQTCTATVVFTPMYPGLRTGAVVITSSDGTAVLGRALIAGVGTGSLAVLDPGIINTIAGNQFWTYSPGNEGYAANASSLYLPYGVAVDPSGKMYVSDTINQRVQMVDTSGKIWTIAGDGTSGDQGDDGPAKSAEVNQPSGLAIDGAGNLYFADSGNDAIRRIDAVTGVITTVAGTLASAGFSGDGGAATAAQLSSPEGIAFDAAGNLFIADTGNDVIREVSAATGMISTVAGVAGEAAYNQDGPATQSWLNMPWAVAVGLDGALYIADMGNSRIRRVIGGVISTVAGSGVQTFNGDGGPAVQAAMNQPYGIALDPAGDLYIADSGNHCIRKVSPGSGVANGTAIIQTIIGVPDDEGFAGDGKAANLAQLNGPYALFFAQNGNFYFADTHNDRVREVVATPFTMPQFPDTKATKVSTQVQTENVDSDGNADLNLSHPALVNAAIDAGTTTCSFSAATAMGTTCVVGVAFAPSIAQQPLDGSVTLSSDAANSPAAIDIWGNGLDVNPTTVTLASSAYPSVTGQTVTFAATVTNGGAGTLTGSVTFTDGGTTLCSNVNLSGGRASCPASFSTVGAQTITASYSGDANNEAMSGTFTQTVKEPATVVLAASPTETTVTDNVTLTATVTASSGTPTGTVVFYDGGTAISGGTVTLNAGSASFSTTQLAPGTHTLTAQYSGDASDAAGASNQVSEVINEAATTTALSASNTSPTVGDSVTLTATVTGTPGFTPTGTVVFTDNGVQLSQSATINSSGVGTVVLNSLAPGTHSIVATYTGDTDDAESWNTHPVLITVAQIQTVTTVNADANPLSAGATLHLTAVVALGQGATADGALTGDVTFKDGSTTLNTVAIDGTGHATLAVSGLAVGTHTIVATYDGATNYATSSSSALSEQVQQTATSVGLAASSASVLAGKPVSFTASVTSATGVPTGSVTFKDGAMVLGSETLSAHGAATFSLSTLTVGTHNITAVYSGDANYLTSTSPGVTETVSLAQPTVTLSGPANAVDVGTAVVLTGAISGPGVTPTGTLTLLDGTTTVASQAVAANGQFRFSTSALTLGTHSLSVAYSGDADNAAANSPALSVTIQLAPTATALSTSSNPGTVGQSVTLTASVVSDSPGVSGTVSFMDGATSLGAAALGTGGTASLTVSLGFGVHSITASYSGDAKHAASSSTAVSERMTQPATATLTSSANPAIAGANVSLTATIAGNAGQIPTGAVAFSDGHTLLGSAALNGAGAATLSISSLAVGQHTITMSYAGDANVASTSATLTEAIVSATTQVNLSSSTALATYGAPLTLTASVTSNGLAPTGLVTFTDSGKAIGSAAPNAQGVASIAIHTLAPGTHTIVASYAGDANTSASASAGLSLVVKHTTAIALNSSSNPALTVSPITLTATLTDAGAAVASGRIVFTDGTTQVGTATLNGAGVATLTLPSLASGTHTLVASYAGDGDDFSSTSSGLAEIVNLRSSATTLSASNTDASNSQEVTLIAVVQGSGQNAPTGTVSFTSGTLQLGTATVNGNGVATITILLDQSSSAEKIVAQYSGDAVYASSDSAAASVQAGPATQFTLSIAPAAMSVVTKQHTTIQLSLNSIAGFSDTIQLGCLGLPFAATCTFSTPETKLAANGTSNVQLTIDTGDPLGMGAQSSAQVRRNGRDVLLCGLPLALLMGLRRKRRKLAYAWLSLVCLTVMISGCSGLQGTSTPPGTYSFKVTASGEGSGATQSQVVTLTVTQ